MPRFPRRPPDELNGILPRGAADGEARRGPRAGEAPGPRTGKRWAGDPPLRRSVACLRRARSKEARGMGEGIRAVREKGRGRPQSPRRPRRLRLPAPGAFATPPAKARPTGGDLTRGTSRAPRGGRRARTPPRTQGPTRPPARRCTSRARRKACGTSPGRRETTPRGRRSRTGKGTGRPRTGGFSRGTPLEWRQWPPERAGRSRRKPPPPRGGADTGTAPPPPPSQDRDPERRGEHRRGARQSAAPEGIASHSSRVQVRTNTKLLATGPGAGRRPRAGSPAVRAADGLDLPICICQ